jgi:hypothetical protein
MGPHFYVPVDDCLRCMYCEALIGSREPCNANDEDGPEPPDEEGD